MTCTVSFLLLKLNAYAAPQHARLPVACSGGVVWLPLTSALTDVELQTIFENLKKPFPLKDMEWKIQSAGMSVNKKMWALVLTYITARAIQDRLDEVIGAENWKNEFTAAPQGGVLCGISLKLNGEWVTKWNGAENTDIEGVKGGLSGAEKRTASEWGIGRYLYALDTCFAEIAEDGIFQGSWVNKKNNNERVYFKWNPPVDKIPDWALCESDLNKRNNDNNKVNLVYTDYKTKIEKSVVLEELESYIPELQQLKGTISQKEYDSLGQLYKIKKNSFNGENKNGIKEFIKEINCSEPDEDKK